MNVLEVMQHKETKNVSIEEIIEIIQSEPLVFTDDENGTRKPNALLTQSLTA